MREVIDVKNWKSHGSMKRKSNNLKTHTIGHNKHACQIHVFGSECLRNQILELLNQNVESYHCDEEEAICPHCITGVKE